MSKDTGGPAFPTDKFMDDGSICSTPGMTLRDYFAAKAVVPIIDFLSSQDQSWINEDVSKEAYRLADAMLAERAK